MKRTARLLPRTLAAAATIALITGSGCGSAGGSGSRDASPSPLPSVVQLPYSAAEVRKLATSIAELANSN